MDETGFRKFLKQMGKKEHVIDGLVKHAAAFESYLNRQSLRSVTIEQLRAYSESLPPDSVKKRMRGVALYYRFAGEDRLAKFASGIRESRIATTRKAFKLAGFRNVDPEHIAALATAGIITVDDMLAAGQTPQLRRQLAKRTGIPADAILELVKLSDLSRLGAVKAVRARLYLAAGFDTPHKLAAWDPEELRQLLIDFVKRSGFDGIAPLPKELRNTVATARKLPKVAQY